MSTIKRLLITGTCLCLLIAGAVAYNKFFVPRSASEQSSDETWVNLEADPWNELDAISKMFTDNMPYTQQGSIRYKNIEGEVEEEKNFTMICNQELSIQSIDQLTVIQGKNYEAIVDHEQKEIIVTPSKGEQGLPGAAQLGLKNLKEIFTKGGYQWQLLTNGKNERILFAPQFSNGAWTGLQIRYSVPGYVLQSVVLGIPKLVSAPIENTNVQSSPDSTDQYSIDIESEGLEINYAPTVKIASTEKPAVYFNMKSRIPILMDKPLEGYRLVNYNSNKK
jgi:hypothetical protein